MRETIADIDLMTIKHLDFEVMCESNWHKPGSNPFLGEAKPADYMVTQKCPDTGDFDKGFLCKECVEAFSKATSIYSCVYCKKGHRGNEWIVTLIPIK